MATCDIGNDGSSPFTVPDGLLAQLVRVLIYLTLNVMLAYTLELISRRKVIWSQLGSIPRASTIIISKMPFYLNFIVSAVWVLKMLLKLIINANR